MGSMNFEVEAAFERLLATAPVETHAVLKAAKYELGMAQWIAETADRHGAGVDLVDWGGWPDCDIATSRFMVNGHAIETREYFATGAPYRWEATIRTDITCHLYADTFDGLFDLIMDSVDDTDDTCCGQS